MHFSDALLKNQKRFSLQFLNGYRFEFFVLRAINSKKNVFLNLIENRTTLLKIRKNENILYLGNSWRKNIQAKNTLFLNKIQGIADKSSSKIREN